MSKEDLGNIMGKQEKHESWGIIHLGRWSSSHGQVFFNSPLKHHHGICLTVSRATRRRAHHSDTLFGEEEVIRLNMTEVQFGQLISTFNQNGQVGCTIEHINGKHMKDCPAENLKEKVSEDLQDHFRKTQGLIGQALETSTRMIDKKRATMAEMRELHQKLDFLEANINGNLDFFKSQFVKEMEHVVTEAKAELEAHAQGIIYKTGLKAIKDLVPKLEG